MQNGQLFEQAILCKPVTTETDGSWLPTPRANSAMAANLNLFSIKNHQHPNLETVISLLPTPRASEWKGCGQVGSKSSLKLKKQGYLSGVINEDCSPQTGEATHLNPAFVEEMMGFEIGHTDLGH